MNDERGHGERSMKIIYFPALPLIDSINDGENVIFNGNYFIFKPLNFSLYDPQWTI